jgi:hypothetical protein
MIGWPAFVISFILPCAAVPPPPGTLLVSVLGPFAQLAAELPITGARRILLILPLCVSIAIVYKTLRCEHLRDIPAAAAILWGTIVVGMYAVGVGLWVLFSLLA